MDSNTAKRLQEHLQLLRTCAGLSMEKLGDQLGVTRQMIYNLETRRNTLTLIQARAIHQLFDEIIASDPGSFYIIQNILTALIDCPDEYSDSNRAEILKEAERISEENKHGRKKVLETKQTLNNQTYERKSTGFIIHGFAVAHAATAAVLAQTVIGDVAALTGLTIAMIICISRLHGKPLSVAGAFAYLSTFVGSIMGTYGALCLIKWIPAIGNIANAATTFAVTELIGWVVYLLVKEEKDPSTLDENSKKDILNRAKKISNEEKDSSKKLYENMTPEDKQDFDKIMKILQTKNLPDEIVNDYTERLTKIAQKYIKH